MRARVEEKDDEEDRDDGEDIVSILSIALILVGAGTLAITASKTSVTPTPSFAEILRISSCLQPRSLITSKLTLSGSAAGKSILLRTGIIVRSLSSAM